MSEKCRCGCGVDVVQHGGAGRPRWYATPACRWRGWSKENPRPRVGARVGARVREVAKPVEQVSVDVEEKA